MGQYMKVAFIGHRTIDQKMNLAEKLLNTVKELIINEKADIFLFGSRSDFNNLCYDTVTKLKETYQYIKRVYVRAEYEFINYSYKEYLLTFYEDTFYPAQVHGAGKLSYIKRNCVLVDESDILVTYCDMGYKPKTGTKSGTKMAVDYALRTGKRIINLFD